MSFTDSDYVELKYGSLKNTEFKYMCNCVEIDDDTQIVLEIIARVADRTPFNQFSEETYVLCIIKILCKCGKTHYLKSEKKIEEQLENFKDRDYIFYIGDNLNDFRRHMPLGSISHNYTPLCLSDKLEVQAYAFRWNRINRIEQTGTFRPVTVTGKSDKSEKSKKTRKLINYLNTFGEYENGSKSYSGYL